MARYVGRVSTPRSAEEAFDYLADFTKVTEWDETAKSSVLLDGPPAGTVGARFAVEVGFAGRTNHFEYTTTVSERPYRLVLRAESSTIVSEDTVTVVESGGQTMVSYDANLLPKGVVKLIDPILGLMFKRLGDNAAGGLARELGGKLES
ncbi:hypothetical protein BH10ACT11_BH10ACT11_14640 [soil metagenome]